ncbi:MAG: hypothetical protein ABIJ09_14300 [Pseudomonadota bacterium]
MRQPSVIFLTLSLGVTSGCALVERSPYGQACDDDSNCGEGYRCLTGYCQPERFTDAAVADRSVADTASADASTMDHSSLDGGSSDAAAGDAVSGDDLAIRDHGQQGQDAPSPDQGGLDASLADQSVIDLGSIFTEAPSLPNPRPAEGDNFGSALAFSGDTLVVGMSRMGSSTAGDTLIYRLVSGTQWHQQQALTPGGLPLAGSSFGYTVAIGGSWLAVGDPTYSNLPGDVHLFEQVSGSWTHRGPLSRATSSNGDGFGSTVAMSADGLYLVVGGPSAPGSFADGGEAIYAGAVWFFKRSGSTWSEVKHQLTPNPGDASNFGSALALSTDGATCVVGAAGEYVPGASLGGAIYVFRRSGSTWSEPTRLTWSTPVAGDEFGKSLAFVDGAVAVGMPGADGRRGRVEVYSDTGSALNHVDTIQAASRVAEDRFGETLAGSGTTLLVGSLTSRDGASMPLQVFVNRSGGWRPLCELLPADALTSEGFGEALAIAPDEHWIAAGLPRRQVGGFAQAGEVAMYGR